MMTATTDGTTTELVCPECGSPVTRDPEFGLFYVTCQNDQSHQWLLHTLLHRQPERTT